MTELIQMSPDEFREQLGRILVQAGQQGNRITREEVYSFFKEPPLTAEQLELVCDFLLSRRIIVSNDEREGQAAGAAGAGNDAAGSRTLLPEESRWLERYREELASVADAGEGELQQLLQRLRQEEETALPRLTELLLGGVLEDAMQIRCDAVLLQDLVQEGNLQLMLAGRDMDWRMTTSIEEARTRLHAAARDAMRALAAEQTETHTQDRRMVEKAENLKEGITALKEEMGRKVYLDEVADFLSMTEEEAEDILRLTGEEPAEESSDS